MDKSKICRIQDNFPSTRLTSTKLWTVEALPGREPGRGARRARTPSVSTSMGRKTKTTVASSDKRSTQQTDSNLSQIAIQCNYYFLPLPHDLEIKLIFCSFIHFYGGVKHKSINVIAYRLGFGEGQVKNVPASLKPILFTE